jgi:hypothetical protein
MINLLKRNNKIIVNTDIDGVLSAYVLCRYCGCEIVGFSNSADCVWWRKDKISSIYDAVYVDMYVPRKDVLTIDQHIIAYDNKMLSVIESYGSKMNPNIDNPRTFLPNGSYYVKYPFGTIHYILSKLGKEDIDITYDLKKLVSDKYGCYLNIADFILRADDAMTTSLNSKYVNNAKKWWWWLKDESKMSNNIVSLTNYLNQCSTKTTDVYKKKEVIASYFKNEFCCDSPDGGFSRITDFNGFLYDKVVKYMSFFFTLLGGEESSVFLNGIFDSRYELSKGNAKRIYMSQHYATELNESGTIDGEEVFSYGYVRSSNRPANFSYTVMPSC